MTRAALCLALLCLAMPVTGVSLVAQAYAEAGRSGDEMPLTPAHAERLCLWPPYHDAPVQVQRWPWCRPEVVTTVTCGTPEGLGKIVWYGAEEFCRAPGLDPLHRNLYRLPYTP